MQKGESAMRETETLAWARGCLDGITPLAFDCGTLCGGLCCKDAPQEEEAQPLNGMLLFPGEDALPMPMGAKLHPSAYFLPGGENISLMTCEGHCEREKRPLACRFFPLIAWINKNGAWHLRMDERARFCPLHGSGIMGLDPSFISAVEAVFRRLWQYDRQRAFILMLCEEQRELRALYKGFLV